MIAIGKYNLLTISDELPQGLYLVDDEGQRILLPRRQVPEQWEKNDTLEVFVYLDSDERLIATRQRPRVQCGQVARLNVTDVNHNGAYLDWGLAKDLLLPFGEQKNRVEIGDSVIVYVATDQQDRLFASTRLNRFIKDEAKANWPGAPDPYQVGDQVRLTITQKTDLGFKAVVDHQYWGVLHHSQVRTAIRVGQTMDGYIRRIRDDYRLDIALEPIGDERTVKLARRILKKLQDGGGSLGLNDHSPAEQIELQLAVSKRLFKMALGRLLKAGDIVITETGIRLASETERKNSQSVREKPKTKKIKPETAQSPNAAVPKSKTAIKKKHYVNPKKKTDKTLSLKK